MEETNQSPDGTTQDAHGDLTETSASDNTVKYETFQKTLKQRARFKEEAEAAAKELEAYKQRELEQKGEYKSLVEAQRKRIAELESKSQTMQKAYQETVVADQVKTALLRKGVNEKIVDKAWKYALAAHRDDLNSIEVDDKYRVNGEDLDRFADKFLTDNVEMGFTKKVGVKDVNPGGSHKIKLNTRDMSAEELDEAWNTVLKS